MSNASTPTSEVQGFRPQAQSGELSSRDLDDLRALGKDPAEAVRELGILRKGAKPLALLRPCTAGAGVMSLTEGERQAAAKRFRSEACRRRTCKFVVAAGSASRMFQVLDGADGESARRALGDRLHQLPFFPALDGEMRRRGLDPLRLAYEGHWKPIADALLHEDGLGFAGLPKALLPFHAYPDGTRTALEEHLVEALGYAVGYGNVLHLHAVVSPPHRAVVARSLEVAAKRFRTPDIEIKTETSVQSDASQTIAIDARGAIVRDASGRIVFRPAGHGAALANLNSLSADLVFIRTVDNVLPEVFHRYVSLHKQALGGVLIETEAAIHASLGELESENQHAISSAEELVRDRLSTPLPADWQGRSTNEKRRFLIDRLNRPLRVCGVAPNGGLPGGAPFWIATSDGPRLRIADKPEVDASCERQLAVWRSNPYFNCADLVCSLRDFRGNAFDLTRYQAADEWYVIERSHGGEPIRVLERSGLWNGGMAEWNTVFVETPRETLRPVKTILELLELPKPPQT